MARIPEYNAPPVRLNPDDRAISAYNNYGRRIAGLYDDLASTAGRAGTLAAQQLTQKGKFDALLFELRKPKALSRGPSDGVGGFNLGSGGKKGGSPRREAGAAAEGLSNVLDTAARRRREEEEAAQQKGMGQFRSYNPDREYPVEQPWPYNIYPDPYHVKREELPGSVPRITGEDYSYEDPGGFIGDIVRNVGDWVRSVVDYGTNYGGGGELTGYDDYINYTDEQGMR